MLNILFVLQRWVPAFRDEHFVVRISTNNGVERQNGILKHDHLAGYRKSSLSRLMNVIIHSYLRDAYVKLVLVTNFCYDRSTAYI